MTDTAKPARERKLTTYIGIEPSVRHRLDLAAEGHQVSTAHVIRWAIREWLERNEKQPR